MDKSVEIRDLVTQAEYRACVELQRETWGREFTETVPTAILQVSQKVGGITAGAFEGDTMVGFVFGLTGIDESGPVHWSDMLAVRASHRNLGIGEALKRYQRDKLVASGVDRMLWTFDPLDAKNAHVNFNRLGVFARTYVPDMYGQTDSPLHTFGTDRLIVTWLMTRARPAASVDERIEIPHDIHAINRADPQAAREWRERTRAQFQRLLPDYVVTGFVRGETNYYALTSTSNFSA